MRLAETGALRLRRLRGQACEALVVNTGGGLVGGDSLRSTFAVEGRGAAVTLGTVAAEKCYRVGRTGVTVSTALRIGAGASLHWLPQETILFEGARLDRSLDVELAHGATLLAAETLVFGRIAHGEAMASGSLDDAWTIRRGGRLLFADRTRIAGEVAATLDLPAVGAGARAAALLVAAGPGAADLLDRLRAAIAAEPAVEGGASLIGEDLVVARLLARAPERLRSCLAALLAAARPALPRGW